jgi:predicted dinucleotide-binding enzyme
MASTTSETVYNCCVIGTGKEGSAITRKLTEHGCKVCTAHSKSAEGTEHAAKHTGATPVSFDDPQCKEADIIFLTIPEKAVSELPKGLLQHSPSDVIVVDCCNYFPSRDGHIDEIDRGMPESIWVKNQIGRPVIKAFNAVLAGVLENGGRPKGSDSRIAIPISGDDAVAKEKIAKLISGMGFDPFDAGDLENSWRLQPGSPIYCTNLTTKQMEKAIRRANKEAMPTLRDQAYEKMCNADTKMDSQSLVQMLRETFADASKQISLEELIGTSQQQEIKTS